MDKIEYNLRLKQLFFDPPAGFAILAAPIDDAGDHPETFIDYECAFAAGMLKRFRPKRVLDIGSYRHFVMGLAASYDVTSVDARKRFAEVDGETCISCDAKRLPIASESFDAVVSLCTLEHFGLGRYGDEFDIWADQQAIDEMIRVLRPGGHLIFTTTISGRPCICFTAHRIYSHDMILKFCSGLSMVREKVYRKDVRCFSEIGEQTGQIGKWDIYLGCWRK